MSRDGCRAYECLFRDSHIVPSASGIGIQKASCAFEEAFSATSPSISVVKPHISGGGARSAAGS